MSLCYNSALEIILPVLKSFWKHHKSKDLDFLFLYYTRFYFPTPRKNIFLGLEKLLKCAIFIVSHLKRPEGKISHEEGLQVSLAHLRGSHSLATMPNQIISFERDQQSETENNILTVRVLKNRFSGDTGIATTLIYNKETGRLSEGDFDE